MDRHARIDFFSLAAHRLVVARLREQPERLGEAIAVLQRWREQSGSASFSNPCWNEWERLLLAGIDAVEQAACAETDQAATLRSASPMGRFITSAERDTMLRQALAAP